MSTSIPSTEMSESERKLTIENYRLKIALAQTTIKNLQMEVQIMKVKLDELEKKPLVHPESNGVEKEVGVS